MKKLILILMLSGAILPPLLLLPHAAYANEDGDSGDDSGGGGFFDHSESDAMNATDGVRGSTVGYTRDDGSTGVAGCHGGNCSPDNGGNGGTVSQRPYPTVTNYDPWVNTSIHDVVTRTVISGHKTVDEGTAKADLNPPGLHCAQDLTDVGELLAGRPVIHKCHN